MFLSKKIIMQITLYIFLIFFCSVGSTNQLTQFGAWIYEGNNASPIEIKSFTPPVDRRPILLSVYCHEKHNQRDGFMLFLLKQDEFSPLDPNVVNVTVKIDNNPQRTLEWFPDIQILRMWKSRWLIKEMFDGQSINIRYEDKDGKHSLTYFLHGFKEAVEKMENDCGYEYTADDDWY